MGFDARFLKYIRATLIMDPPLQFLLNPPTGLSLSEIAFISFVLGLLHGATPPDEHTWPITFSYAIGKYSTRGGGMKAGLLFSLGFTVQRALLTTLGTWDSPTYTRSTTWTAQSTWWWGWSWPSPGPTY